jgi:uncharacterized protein YozE (UPF0346 family)
MDVATYRAAESQGRRAVRSIRHSGVHNPETFDAAAFPVRVEGHDDLAAYLDVMHEGRFEPMMGEFDGLSDDELTALLDGFEGYAKFFLSAFNSARIPLPLAGMLSQYRLFLKLQGIPERADVLEIGPGSSLASFFLRTDSAIGTYDQIETAEAFYLLQNLIGRFLYGHRYRDHAQIDAFAAGLGDVGVAEALKVREGILDFDDERFDATVERHPVAEHFPWWKLRAVFDRSYDVVTANANLTEFSLSALRYYSALTRSVLKPNGVFLAQCVGGGATDMKVAVKTFMESGFVPLVFAGGYQDGASGPVRQFATMNVVLLPPTHVVLNSFSLPSDGGPLINPRDPLTRDIFGMDRAKGQRFTKAELAELIRERLAQAL